MKISTQNAADEGCSHRGSSAYDGYFLTPSPLHRFWGISGANRDQRAPFGPGFSANALVQAGLIGLGQFRLLIGHGLARPRPQKSLSGLFPTYWLPHAVPAVVKSNITPDMIDVNDWARHLEPHRIRPRSMEGR